MTPLFLTLEEVFAIHANQIELYGGDPGTRDEGLLRSALAQPEASFGGEWLHSTLPEMAAAYLPRRSPGGLAPLARRPQQTWRPCNGRGRDARDPRARRCRTAPVAAGRRPDSTQVASAKRRAELRSAKRFTTQPGPRPDRQSHMRLEFDRGTVLLLAPSPAADVATLPGVLWDPRVGRFRAPACRYPEITSELRQRGCSFEDALGFDPPPGQPSLRGWNAPPLRPYQQAALLAWATAGRRGTLVLPTGSGKTRLACAAMAQTGAPTLCLVPTRALMHQWRHEIGAWYQGPIGCLGDGEHQVESVTITTFESAYRRMDRLGDRFALLVVDEAHHFGRGIRDEALELAAAPLRLGLTATPDPEGLPRVADLIGPVVFELNLGDLAGRWLADFDLVLLRTPLTADERRRYDEELRIFRPVFREFRKLAPDAPWADFVAASSRSDAGRRALAAWRRSRDLLSLTEGKRRLVESLLERHGEGRTLVFTANNAAAYAIAREHLVMPITCDIARAEREQALAAFRDGELRTLVSARVLNEGIDVPDADVAIIVGGVQGEREHVQRVGRLLRPRPGKRALVYELVTTRTSEERQSAHRRQALGRASAQLL